MGWATGHIERLQQGETVSFRPRGHSMRGKVDNGALVTVEPLGERVLAVGDIVLCKVGGRSSMATDFLLQQGWPDVTNIAGGITAWAGAGLPTTSGPVAPGEGDLPTG